MRALHGFRADLRLSDNSALAATAACASEIAFLFVLDDALFASPRVAGAYVRRFVPELRDVPVEAIARFEEARRAALA